MKYVAWKEDVMDVTKLSNGRGASERERKGRRREKGENKKKRIKGKDVWHEKGKIQRKGTRLRKGKAGQMML